MLFGILLALVLFVTIVVVESLFPRLGGFLGQHNLVVQAVSFSIFLFGWCIYILWHWHRRRLFWMVMTMLLLMHIAGLFLFATYLSPTGVSRWTPVLFVEAFAIFVVVDWTMRRFGRSWADKSNHPE